MFNHLIGTVIKCQLTVLLISPITHKEYPTKYIADCEVHGIFEPIKGYGMPHQMIADCSKSLKWLDTKHQGKNGLTYLNLTDEDGCYE